jgi:hypothetical protein
MKVVKNITYYADIKMQAYLFKNIFLKEVIVFQKCQKTCIISACKSKMIFEILSLFGDILLLGRFCIVEVSISEFLYPNDKFQGQKNPLYFRPRNVCQRLDFWPSLRSPIADFF